MNADDRQETMYTTLKTEDVVKVITTRQTDMKVLNNNIPPPWTYKAKIILTHRGSGKEKAAEVPPRIPRKRGPTTIKETAAKKAALAKIFGKKIHLHYQ